MLEVHEDILANGRAINPARGPAWERTGVLLELTNPRARLSRTETRGRLFSPLGELSWYLAASEAASFIRYYVTAYPGADSEGVMPGAYGPRLFRGGGDSQFRRVRNLLAARPDTRQAVLQIFNERDLQTGQEDVPCTCSFQFLARRGALDLIVHMRSNDAFWGLLHDVFCFTMFHEIMASDLSLRLGTYRHFVGSLHLYERNVQRSREFLGEGWQTRVEMPAMPPDPWDSIQHFLRAEATIRAGGEVTNEDLGQLGDYWGDLVRLLLIFRHSTKTRDLSAVTRVAKSLRSDIYRLFVDAKATRLT